MWQSWLDPKRGGAGEGPGSQPRSRRVGWLLAGGFLLLAMVIGLLGKLYLHYQHASFRRSLEDQLTAVADLKVRQIAAWHDDLFEAARLILRDPFLPQQVQQFLASPGDGELRVRFLEWFKTLQRHYEFGRALLVDPQMNVRLALPEHYTNFGPIAQSYATEAIRSNHIVISDLHRSRFNGAIHFDLAIPIGATDGQSEPGSALPEQGRQPMAAIDMEVDPHEFLYPTLQTWPTSSRTAETLLVRREGDEVIILNELRHRTNTALSMRLSLSRQEFPVVQAALGREGVLEGRDYRGQPVLAAIRRVPKTTWVLVSKIDAEEVYAPLRVRDRLALTAIGLLILAAGLGLWSLWRQQEIRHLKEEAALERQRKQLAERLAQLNRQVNDAVVLADQDQRIIEVNDRAAQLYGYSAEEFQSLSTRDLRASRGQVETERQLRQMGDRDGIIFETQHRRKDGTVFPVEMSVRRVELDGRWFYQGIVRDLIERQRSEQALRQSEARFRSYVEQAPQPIFVLNRQGRCVDFNPAALGLLGCDGATLLNLSLAEVLEDADRESVLQDFAKLTGGGAMDRECRIKDADGRLLWVFARAVKIAEDRFLVFCQDISERKWNEAASAENLRRFQIVADYTYDWEFWYERPGGPFVYCSPSCERITGFAREEFLRDPQLLERIIHPEDLTRWRRHLEEACASDEVSPVEFRILHRDGSLRWISHICYPLGDGKGGSLGRRGSNRDVTARKQAEARVADALKYVQTVLAACPVGIVAYRASGETISANAAVARIVGGTPEQMANLNFRQLESWKKCGLFGAAEAALATGEQQRAEAQFVSTFGKPVWLSCLFVPFTHQSQPHLLGLFTDIAEAKKAEQERAALQLQLQQGQKLESIGRLAAGIAHEINTPTQYVGDNVQFFKKAFADLSRVLDAYGQLLAWMQANGGIPPTAAELLRPAEKVRVDFLQTEIPKAIDDALDGVERVSNIVRAMKEFSHPGGCEKKAVDLNRAIESTLTVCRNEWKYVAEMVTQLDPDLPPVPCLPGEFNQVILNLVINAAHAIADVVGKGPGKGTITVSTQAAGDWAEIRVQDTGTGIAEKARGHIFEPFFTTKGVGKGTGQGLALARSVIVDKHGGSIRFETESGKGTTFVIRLPLRPAATTEQRKAA